MGKAWFNHVLVLVVLAGVGSAATAASFEDGWSAFRNENYQKAYEIWLPLARAGSTKAQNNLGLMYLKGYGVAQSYANAAHWFGQAVNNGFVQANISLGSLYIQGLGVKRDYFSAFELFYVAAREGYPQAQYNLGMMYADGVGVSRDYSKAMKWWRLAARQGHADAESARADLLKQGLGLKRLPYPKTSRWSKFG